VSGTANALVWGNTSGVGSTSYWEEWQVDMDNINN
jgi:hypothetical protein